MHDHHHSKALSSFGFLITMLVSIVDGIKYFIILLFAAIFAFAIVFNVMIEGDDSDDGTGSAGDDDAAAPYATLANALWTVYDLAGEMS